MGSHFAGYDPPFSLLVVAAALGFVGFGITVWSTPSPKRYRFVALAVLMGGALISATHAPPGLAHVLFASAFIVMIGFAAYENSVEKSAKVAPGNGADPGA